MIIQVWTATEEEQNMVVDRILDKVMKLRIIWIRLSCVSVCIVKPQKTENRKPGETGWMLVRADRHACLRTAGSPSRLAW